MAYTVSLEKLKQLKPAAIAGFLALVLLVSTFVTTINPAVARAATLNSSSSLGDQVIAYATFNAMVDCLQQEIQQANNYRVPFGVEYRIDEENVRSGNWWRTAGDPFWATTQGAESPGTYLNTKTNEAGNTLCNDVLTTAVNIFGFNGDYFDFMCSFVDFRAGNSSSSCETGTGAFGGLRGSIDKFKEVIGERVWGQSEPRLTLDAASNDAGLYILYREAFLVGCSAEVSSSPGRDFRYDDIRIITNDGEDSTETYEGVNRGDNRSVYRMASSSDIRNCASIASRVNELAGAFKAYLLANDGAGVGISVPIDRCTDNDTSDGDSCAATATSCGVEGLGWVICPALSFMTNILNDAFKALADNFLRIEVALFSTDSGTFIGWSIFRNIANVAFVIVFLIIIFSQLTGVGVSNYGVKKLLPRIIVTAILVNISFFICQIAVDLSNILGYSLKTAFDSIAISADVPTSSEASANGYGIAALTTAVIATAVVSYFALGVLIPVLLGAVVAILMVVLILVARQAIIVLLIVLSPLAFVAYLLPNTENLFTKWRKAFVTLLLVFPIVSVVFGAASLASQILSQATDANGDSAQAMQIIAVGVATLPFFVIPVLLKSAIDGIGSIGSKLNSFGSRSGGALGKAGAKGYQGTRLGKYQQFRREKRQIKRALTQSGAYTGPNKLRRKLSDFNRTVNTSAIGGEFGDRLAAQGVGLARETEEKAAKEQATLLRSQIASGAMTNEKLDTELSKAFQSGDRVKTKALQDVMFEQGGSGMNRYTEAVRKAQSVEGGMSPASFEALRENINTKHGQLVKSKSAGLSKMAGTGGTLNQHTDDIGTWALSAGDLAGQTGAQLQYAADKKLINPVVARTMMKDARIRERLDPDQQAALTKASQETEESYKQLVIEADIKKKKVAQDTAFATYESAGNVETYRQAGEAKVEAAAQGSAGTTPFVVDNSGAVTSNTVSGRAKSIQVESGAGQVGEGVFVVDRSGDTEAPTPPAPSVLDVNPDAAQRVADLNNPYRTMDQSQPTPVNPADTSNIFGTSTTSINVPVTVPPEPVRAPNPFSTMEQPSPQNPVDPADISAVTGQSSNESINIPLSDEEKK